MRLTENLKKKCNEKLKKNVFKKNALTVNEKFS
jgi:hypothetical protein